MKLTTCEGEIILFEKCNLLKKILRDRKTWKSKINPSFLLELSNTMDGQLGFISQLSNNKRYKPGNEINA
jgi:hypothetical protein